MNDQVFAHELVSRLNVMLADPAARRVIAELLSVDVEVSSDFPQQHIPVRRFADGEALINVLDLLNGVCRTTEETRITVWRTLDGAPVSLFLKHCKDKDV